MKLLFSFIFLFSCAHADNNYQSSFHIEFIKDKKYDVKALFSILRQSDPAGLESRAKSMGIEIEMAKKIQAARDPEEDEEIISFVDQRYRESGLFIEKSINLYASSWKDIENDFGQVLKKYTGYYPFYDEYECVVSAFHPGLSNWYGNKIARSYGIDGKKQRMITAYEIILSHVFHIVRINHSGDELGDWKVWAIAELGAALIVQTSGMRRFWPWEEFPKNYFENSNYPQLAKMEKDLKPVFAKLGFRGFVDSAVKYMK